ncbi:MAG: methylglyoxal synthase [Candidatus Thiodiazotropha sp.]
MEHTTVALKLRKCIALVAHDHKKEDLLEWVQFNAKVLAQQDIVSTGTTGSLLERELGLSIRKLQSDPLVGDHQVGRRISEGAVDMLIFFWDPLVPTPHDPDVKALLRIAVAWNIPVAFNEASADFVFSSPLIGGECERVIPDYQEYLTRAAFAGAGPPIEPPLRREL